MLHGVVTLVQLLLPELAGVLFLKALLSRISMMRHESYRNRDLTPKIPEGSFLTCVVAC